MFALPHCTLLAKPTASAPALTHFRWTSCATPRPWLSSADIYQRPLADFQRLNPGWQADKALPFDTLVCVPDPGFVPLLAARFAAELRVAPALTAEKRITCIQALAPLAVGNPTALDAVLTQLLLAAGVGRSGDRAVFTQLQAEVLNP